MNLLVIEISAIVMYLLFMYIADKAKKIDFLIYATIFAAFFENLNIYIFRESASGYFYNTGFSLFFIFTPLFIILIWGVIITSSYILAKKLTGNNYGTILLTPILAVMIDFAFEFVAVRLGYWEWIGYAGYGLNSVPHSNFVGWLSVSLGFVIVYEMFRHKWLSTFLGYAVFLIISIFFHMVQLLFGIEGLAGYSFVLAMIFMLLTSFMYLNRRAKRSVIKIENTDLYTLIILRSSFYLFSAMYILKLEMYNDIPVFLLFIASTAVEILLWFYAIKNRIKN